MRVGLAGCARSVPQDWLDADSVTNLELAHALANLLDDAGELVPHDDRYGIAGQRVGRRRAEDGTADILVEVAATDAAIDGTNLRNLRPLATEARWC